MGIFTKIKDYRDSRQKAKIDKAARLVKTVKAIKEDRWAAIELLCGLEDVETSVRNLLPRFEFSLEHGINDTREKELAMEGIISHGKAALPILKEWIQSTSRIAWPIKILKKIASDEEVVEALKSALNFDEVSFNQAAVDKNFDILCYLREYQLGSFTSKVQHFLRDSDERVRFACIEALIEQNSTEIPGLLEPYLEDESAENIRIRQSVIRAFLEKGWVISDPSRFEGGVVVSGVRVRPDGTLSN